MCGNDWTTLRDYFFFVLFQNVFNLTQIEDKESKNKVKEEEEEEFLQNNVKNNVNFKLDEFENKHEEIFENFKSNKENILVNEKIMTKELLEVIIVNKKIEQNVIISKEQIIVKTNEVFTSNYF